MVEDKERHIRDLPLFAGVSEEGLSKLAACLTEFEAPQGHVFVQPNLAASGMFIIMEGSVEVEATGGVKRALGPGEFFGELALLTERDRTARVKAATDTRCLALAREDFRTILESEPKLALNMLEILAERLSAEITG